MRLGLFITEERAFNEDTRERTSNILARLDRALVSLEGILPDRDIIAEYFGPNSPAYQRDIETLRTLYQENAGSETIRVKRRLWYDLLRAHCCGQHQGEPALTWAQQFVMHAKVAFNVEENTIVSKQVRKQV